MKEIGPIAGIDCKNTMTEINHAEGRDCQGITEMTIKESIIIHFRTMEIGENIRRVIKYRDENFHDSDRSYDMDDSHSRDRSYSRDRLRDYHRDVYKEDNHKYKRRSRVYYGDAYEDRHDRDKYKHQYRNESYNLGRDISREKQCECNARKNPYFSKLELVNNTI